MYPICLGFQQGVSWGRCWKDVPLDTCQFQDEPWFDVTMWGDTLSVHLNWDFNAAAFGGACTAQVSWNGQQVAADTSIKQITMMSTEVNGALVSDEAAAGLSDLEVTGGAVLKRPTVGDILLEIPSGFATCGYDPSCGVADYHKFDFSVANTHPTEERTLRLIISRQFYPGNGYPSWTRSTKQFAEITGMSAMIWGDQTTLEPIGLPHQISKQWHNDVPSEYSANTKKADGSVVNSHWWTVNIIVHLPPNFSKDLSLALAYEKYRGVQSWSHSQLSLIGWSESTNWLWEEAALGMSGENFVIDPLGENTQAAITDVRPKLFDGVWKGRLFLLLLATKKAHVLMLSILYQKTLEEEISGSFLMNLAPFDTRKRWYHKFAQVDLACLTPCIHPSRMTVLSRVRYK